MRQRRTSSSSGASPTAYSAPGDLVREAARRHGWDLGLNNLMVEGTTDESYFHLADKKYHETHGKHLVGDDLRVFAVGELDEGGTDAINEKLNVLSSILKIDPVDQNGDRLRVIALFDDDYDGRKTFAAMKGRFVPWGDIFLLKRKYPRTTRDANTFLRGTKSLNLNYCSSPKHYCEIEDLLDRALVDLFVEKYPNCLQHEMAEIADGFHSDLHGWAKGKLAAFVEEEASLDELLQIVEVLKTFRFLFGLPIDGV